MLSQRAERPTARPAAATPTPCTRSPNIKKVRKARPLRVEDVTIENNQATVDKPSPSSERKPKPPRKSLSGSSVTNAKGEESLFQVEPRVSSSWISKKSKRKTPAEETPCTNDLDQYLNSINPHHYFRINILFGQSPTSINPILFTSLPILSL